MICVSRGQLDKFSVIVEVQDQMCLGAALIRNRRSANNPADVSEKEMLFETTMIF